MMPRKQLITSDYDEISGSKLIKHVDSGNVTTPLIQQIRNSYAFRMEEIRRGHIEEAETMDVMNTEGGYYKAQEDEKLCPLSVELKDKKTKAYKKSEQVFNPSKKFSFEDNTKEPYEIATSHAILKGRLK